jgi:hypothetical protein
LYFSSISYLFSHQYLGADIHTCEADNWLISKLRALTETVAPESFLTSGFDVVLVSVQVAIASLPSELA